MKLDPKPVSELMDCSVHEAVTSDVVSLGALGESFDGRLPARRDRRRTHGDPDLRR